MSQGTVVARSCWLLVHPDGRVKWRSIDFREGRPKTFVWFTRWRWQRWTIARDPDRTLTERKMKWV